MQKSDRIDKKSDRIDKKSVPGKGCQALGAADAMVIWIAVMDLVYVLLEQFFVFISARGLIPRLEPLE